jgi:purine-binding chemotaxis protein CheW
VSGLVTFRLGEREYATPLSDVREVVRLEGLTDLPGMVAPLAGVLDLRGSALPVLDLRRGAAAGDRGDVLVLERGGADGRGGLVDGSTVGVAVDQVRAVLSEGALPLSGAPTEQGVLPGYVVEVLRGASGVVFLVDLARMVDSARTSGGAG